MTVGFSPPETARLRERLSGRLALPGEQAYDAARRVWNAAHDYRPALVVQPRTTADVQAAVGSPATGSCQCASAAAGTTTPAMPSPTGR